MISMQTRPLGRTGLDVSVMSLGGVALGDMYGTLRPGEASDCVHRAIDVGVNLIDTSPFYGLTRSETVLGEILRGGLREKILLCTKAGRDDVDRFDFTPKHIAESVEASLGRLGTDYVDILIAHDIEFADDLEAVYTETADALHRLKEKGKCRFVGMSAYPLGVLRTAIERCRLDVVISYCHFSLQNTKLLSELLPVAEAHGVGLLNASPLSMGLLTDQGPQSWHPAPPEIKAAAREAAELCRQRGTNIASLGMQFAFSEPHIASTITGAARAEEVDRNVEALNLPLDRELLTEVMATLDGVRDQTWPSGN